MANTIVLIDDDPDDLEILKEAILSFRPGTHCISFISPVEAIRVTSEDLVIPPDYFFIDINMPLMTGDNCLKVLRQNKAFQNSIITILSTSVSPDESLALMKLGANYTFPKPYCTTGYDKIVAQVLQNN